MGRRWILARPRGGLNDTLCQIEKCWRFAEKTGRELVIDSKDSGLLLDFHEVFEVRDQGSKVIPYKLSKELVEELNKLSAFPADVQGSVTAYDKFKDEHDEFFTLPSRQPLKFSLMKDFPEDLVVYEGMGGGVDSFCALERLAFAPWLARTIIDSLRRLPEHYMSVHVRHSDMRTDYRPLLSHVRRKNVGESPVFVASDHNQVLREARAIFGDDMVLTLPSRSERSGKPLHRPSPGLSEEQRRIRTIEALSELFALSGADTLYFTQVSNRTGVSGFSRLAAHLAKKPFLRQTLLGGQSRGVEHRKCRPVLVAPLHRRLLETFRWRRRGCFTRAVSK